MRSCVIRPPRAAAARGGVLKRAEEKSSKRVFWAQKPWSSFKSSSFWVRASRARDQSPLLRQSRRRQSLFERRFQNCEMEKGTARFVKHISAQREEEKEGHTKPHQLTNKINEKRTSFLRARERKREEEEEEKEEDLMAAARFSDETGEALNEAAFRLIREATKEDATTAKKTTKTTLEEDRLNAEEEESSSSSSLKWIETVKITPGRHKYVLIDVYNERNERKLIVRSYANCGYHADNYRVGMRELRDDSHFSRSGGVRGRVIGGGRIEYDPESKSVNVYGYSMTFGRTPGCNKKTMEIIQREMGLVHAQWSDDGY